MCCTLSTMDSVLGRASEVEVSMPRRGKLVNVHDEGTPGRGKSCIWMGNEIGEGLLTACQNSSLLILVYAYQSGWPSPLSEFAEFLPCVEGPFSVFFYHKEGAWVKGEPGDLRDRKYAWPETLGSDLSCFLPRRMPSSRFLPVLCLLPAAFQTETL